MLFKHKFSFSKYFDLDVIIKKAKKPKEMKQLDRLLFNQCFMQKCVYNINTKYVNSATLIQNQGYS